MGVTLHSCSKRPDRRVCGPGGGGRPATFQAANPQGSAAGPAGLPASGMTAHLSQ